MRAALVSLILLFSAQTQAFWTHDGEKASFDLAGNLRSIMAGFQNFDSPLLFGEDNSGDGLSQSLLRLTAQGEVEGWFAFEVHGVQDWTFSTSTFSALTLAPSDATRYRALKASWSWADTGDLSARLSLDRLNVRFSMPHVDLTLGRQAINFAQTNFWSTLDVFLPFSAQSFDREYKPGIDAIRVDLSFSPFSGMNILAVAGRTLHMEDITMAVTTSDQALDLSWKGSALMGRFFLTAWDWDFSLQGGKVYGGYQLAAGFSGELLTLGVRGEGGYFFAMEDEGVTIMNGAAAETVQLIESHGSAVISIDHRFESSLHLMVEYFYNGTGEADKLTHSFARAAMGQTSSLGEHLLGLMASYEIVPVLVGNISVIFSASDLSALIAPGLSYSISDESEFLLGAMIALGDRPDGLEFRSEFGSYPNIFYGEFKFYF